MQTPTLAGMNDVFVDIQAVRTYASPSSEGHDDCAR